MVESIVILCDAAPVGLNSAVEAIRFAAGIGALGEAVPTKVVLMGDAVYLLSKAADPTSVGQDSYAQALEIADLSDLEIYVLDTALSTAGLDPAGDLIDYANLKVVSMDHIVALVDEATTTFRL